MFQKFFTKTIESKFIKNLLSNTLLPTYKVVNSEDYLFKDSIYIYKDYVIKCTKSGYIDNYIWDRYGLFKNYRLISAQGDFDELKIATKKEMTAINNTNNLKNKYYINFSDYLEISDDSTVKIPVENSITASLGYTDKELQELNKSIVTTNSNGKYFQICKATISDQQLQEDITRSDIYIVVPIKNETGELQPNFVFKEDTLFLRNVLLYKDADLEQDIVFNKGIFEQQIKSKDISKFPQDGIPLDNLSNIKDYHWYTLISENKPLAEFERLSKYKFGQYYPQFTEKHVSQYGYYDSDTHEKLGKYLDCLDKIYQLDLKPFYNCYSGRLADSVYFNKTQQKAVQENVIIPKGWIIGDINHDGKVNDEDIGRLRDYIGGKIDFSDDEFFIADVNNDGIIDDKDIEEIKKYPKSDFLTYQHFGASDKSLFDSPTISDYTYGNNYLYVLNTKPIADEYNDFITSENDDFSDLNDDDFQVVHYGSEIDYTAHLLKTKDYKTWEYVGDPSKKGAVSYNYITYYDGYFFCQTGNELLVTENIEDPTGEDVQYHKYQMPFQGKIQVKNGTFFAFNDALLNNMNKQDSKQILYYTTSNAYKYDTDWEWHIITNDTLPNGTYSNDIIYDGKNFSIICDVIENNEFKNKYLCYTNNLTTWKKNDISGIKTTDLQKPLQYFFINNKYIIYAPSDSKKCYYITSNLDYPLSEWAAKQLSLDYYNPKFINFNNNIFVFFEGETAITATKQYIIIDINQDFNEIKKEEIKIEKVYNLPYIQTYLASWFFGNAISVKSNMLVFPKNISAGTIIHTAPNSKDLSGVWDFDVNKKLWTTRINGTFTEKTAQIILCDLIKQARFISTSSIQIWVEFPPVEDAIIPISSIAPEYSALNDPNSNFKVAQIPIKYNQTYTIAMDSNSEVTLQPAILKNGRFVYTYNSDKVRINLTEQLKVKPITKNKTLFKQPFTYRVDLFEDSPNSKMLEINEKNLYLLIQVPSTLNTSLVVLEGDYTLSDNCKKVYDMQELNRLTPAQKNDLFISTLSLLRFNSKSSYAFSNRLIEYLTLNVINHLDDIDQNIIRVQEANNLYYLPDVSRGAWSDYMRAYYFNKMMKINKVQHIDLTGFIDKDTEKFCIK